PDLAHALQYAVFARRQAERALPLGRRAHEADVGQLVHVVRDAVAVVVLAVARLALGPDGADALDLPQAAHRLAELALADVGLAARLAHARVVLPDRRRVIDHAVAVVVQAVADLHAAVGRIAEVLAAVERVAVDVVVAGRAVRRRIERALAAGALRARDV